MSPLINSSLGWNWSVLVPLRYTHNKAWDQREDGYLGDENEDYQAWDPREDGYLGDEDEDHQAWDPREDGYLGDEATSWFYEEIQEDQQADDHAWDPREDGIPGDASQDR